MFEICAGLFRGKILLDFAMRYHGSKYAQPMFRWQIHLDINCMEKDILNLTYNLTFERNCSSGSRNWVVKANDHAGCLWFGPQASSMDPHYSTFKYTQQNNSSLSTMASLNKKYNRKRSDIAKFIHD